MQWFQNALLTLLTIALFFGFSQSTLAQEDLQEVDQVIIHLKEKPSNDGFFMQDDMFQTLEHDPTGRFLTAEVPEGQTLEAFIKELEGRSDVEFAEPDHKLQLFYTGNDPYLDSKQTHHGMIGTKKAWDKTRGVNTVKVAVLDDGFETSHSDLANEISGSYYTTSYFSNGQHGTHVAGIIGATLNNGKFGAGVAPGAGLYVIDVFEGDGANTSDVIDAIYGAVDLDADIINMSLGGYTYNYSLDLAVQYAHEQGLVIVAAAGNDNTDYPVYPASLDNVISVGSVDANQYSSDFSNYGSYIDVVAPGENIYSTLPGNSFGAMDGTSMAAPVVAGIAALIKSNEPYLTNVEIENRLTSTAIDLGNKGKDYVYGYGRVSAQAALAIITPPAPVVDEITENSTFIQGEMVHDAKGGQIIVKRGSTEIARSTKLTGKGYFSIPIPAQAGGTTLTITFRDQNGNSSMGVPLYVDFSYGLPLYLSTMVTHHTTRVIGETTPFATVYVESYTSVLAEGQADEWGRFEIPIPKQTIGDYIYLLAETDDYESSDYVMHLVINGNYPDLVKTHWALPSIMYLRDGLIIGGYPEGTFQPDRHTTRAEAARMLASAMNLPILQTSSGYADVPSTHWADDYIAAVSKAGYFSGKPGNKFDPNGKLTRAEMARIMSSAFGFEASSPTHFTDVASNHWANSYIAAIFEQGITQGYPDGTYRPNNPTTRAEFSVFLEKSIKAN